MQVYSTLQWADVQQQAHICIINSLRCDVRRSAGAVWHLGFTFEVITLTELSRTTVYRPRAAAPVWQIISSLGDQARVCTSFCTLHLAFILFTESWKDSSVRRWASALLPCQQTLLAAAARIPPSPRWGMTSFRRAGGKVHAGRRSLLVSLFIYVTVCWFMCSLFVYVFIVCLCVHCLMFNTLLNFLSRSHKRTPARSKNNFKHE